MKARVEKGRPRRGCQASGLGSGRRGSALTRADDDGFDRGWETSSEAHLWWNLSCSAPPSCYRSFERSWVRRGRAPRHVHAWHATGTSFTATCRRSARRRDNTGCRMMVCPTQFFVMFWRRSTRSRRSQAHAGEVYRQRQRDRRARRANTGFFIRASGLFCPSFDYDMMQ